MWDHRADGTSTWTQWWENGRKKAESTWRGGRCDGLARLWDPHGAEVRRETFRDGFPAAASTATED
jgi:hypothetical protein